VIAQGARVLWRQRYRQLLPNRPIHVSAKWLAQVELDGPEPVFRLVGK